MSTAAMAKPQSFIPHGDKHNDSTFKIIREGPHAAKDQRPEISHWLREYGHAKAADRYDTCGDKYYLRGCKCGTITISGSRCENKLCPHCREKAFWDILHKCKHIEDRFPESYHDEYQIKIIHINPINISDQDFGRKAILDFKQIVTKLFKHPDVMKVIKGSKTGVEVTRPFKKKFTGEVNTDPNRSWNLHSHTLAEGLAFIPVNILLKAYYEITGSRDVRIIIKNVGFKLDDGSELPRSVYKRLAKSALIEVIKYVTKPPDLGEPRSYARYFDATYKAQLLTSLGTFNESGTKHEDEIFEPDYDTDLDTVHLDGAENNDGKKKKTPGIHTCPSCEGEMQHLFNVKPKEALRWFEWAVGPLPQLTGHQINMGFPRSFNEVCKAIGGIPVTVYIDKMEVKPYGQ